MLIYGDSSTKVAHLNTKVLVACPWVSREMVLFVCGYGVFFSLSQEEHRFGTCFNKYILSNKIPYGDQVKKRIYIEISIVHYTKSETQRPD